MFTDKYKEEKGLGPKERVPPDDMADFYRVFLVAYREEHSKYNREWWLQNLGASTTHRHAVNALYGCSAVPLPGTTHVFRTGVAGVVLRLVVVFIAAGACRPTRVRAGSYSWLTAAAGAYKHL